MGRYLFLDPFVIRRMLIWATGAVSLMKRKRYNYKPRHTHVACDYLLDRPRIARVVQKRTLCEKPRLTKYIDSDNPTCPVCYCRKNPLLSDLQWDDRLFQMWLNEYDAMYRHMLSRGFTTTRAAFITEIGMPSYCKWLSHRLWERVS